MDTNVRIGFSTSSSLISRVIRFFTRGKASHTYFLLDFERWKIVIGADWNGVVAQSKKRFEEAGNKTLAIFSSQDLDFDLDRGMPFLMDRLDVGYDYLGLFGMAFVEVASWFGKRIENPWGSPYKQFCSEAAGEMLRHINFPGSEVLNPRSLDPNELWNFLQARAWEVAEEKARKAYNEALEESYAEDRVARGLVRK